MTEEAEKLFMDDIQVNLAEYNRPLNFIVKFIAPKQKEIYKSFIIEEKLHRGLTFNMKNTMIKADNEIIIGKFNYNDKEKTLQIEFDNPAEDRDLEVEVIIATNITSLASVIESNCIINNRAYIKIKGYEDITGLITTSNMISIKFSSIKIDIITEKISEIIPAIDGEDVIIKASFHTLDTCTDYTLDIRSNLGYNMIFEELKSYVAADKNKIEPLEFSKDDDGVSIYLNNSSEIRNKKLEIIICAKLQNVENINNEIYSEFILSINGAESSRDVVKIPLIKPIPKLINVFVSEK